MRHFLLYILPFSIISAGYIYLDIPPTCELPMCSGYIFSVLFSIACVGIAGVCLLYIPVRIIRSIGTPDTVDDKKGDISAGSLDIPKKPISLFAKILGSIYWAYILMVCAAVGMVYYIHTVSPGILSTIYISDGTRTVQFEQMSHIATQKFYDQVSASMYAARGSGAVLYYEGVTLGTPANTKKFNEYIGFDFSSDTYSGAAHILGLVEQDQKTLVKTFSGKTYNVDISMDDVVKYIDEAVGTGGIPYTGNTTYTGTPIGTGVYTGTTNTQMQIPDISDVLSQWDMLTPREQYVSRYLMRVVLSSMVSNMDGIYASMGEKERKIFGVLLDTRNKNLANTVSTSKNQYIVIMYGAAHFDGFFAELKKKDQKWKIVRIESRKVYE